MSVGPSWLVKGRGATAGRGYERLPGIEYDGAKRFGNLLGTTEGIFF